MGFESEDQLRAFIKAFSDASIPGKFAYVGEAAKIYNTHALTREYSQVTRSVADESSLLLDACDQDLDSIKTLVDIGPGNGLHSVAVLRRLLSTANWLPSEYLAIDYSFHMAQLAKLNMERLAPKVRTNSVLYDIESASMQESRLSNAFESIYFLLGNTIGNVESISRALQGIRNLAGRGARLLIGCALFDECRSVESYLTPYLMNTYRDCVLYPLMMIGVPRHVIAFSVEFDSSTRTILTLARFKQKFSTTVLDESVTVKAGSTVRCALSRRFLPGEIPDLLTRLNSSVLRVTEDLPNGHGTYYTILDLLNCSLWLQPVEQGGQLGCRVCLD
jgi:Histidine-specific methyltransferase, SAM-dependent